LVLLQRNFLNFFAHHDKEDNKIFTMKIGAQK